MRHMITVGVVAALLALSGLVTVVGLACREEGGASTSVAPGGGAASTEPVVNVRCPMKGKAIDRTNVPESLRREYKGQQVGFCCKGCPAAWDKLTDAEKDAKLAAAMEGAPQPPAGKVVNVVCPIMGSKIDPGNVPDSLTRDYKGQKVGFCCGGCPTAWDKLTDAEKDTKLQAALPKQ